MKFLAKKTGSYLLERGKHANVEDISKQLRKLYRYFQGGKGFEAGNIPKSHGITLDKITGKRPSSASAKGRMQAYRPMSKVNRKSYNPELGEKLKQLGEREMIKRWRGGGKKAFSPTGRFDLLNNKLTKLRKLANKQAYA